MSKLQPRRSKSTSSLPSATSTIDYGHINSLLEDSTEHEDDIAIKNFHELKDATADTYTYTFFAFEALVTLFLLGHIKEYFYIVHTVKVFFLLSLRFYIFKKIGKHYFFLELCTCVHALILFYIWSPWKPKGLFPVIFLFANGSTIWSIYFWRNSFVPHSMEKMCTLFVHISPSLVVWCIRWYSTPEQGFELCANPTEPGVNGCTHVTLMDMFIDSTPYYLTWVTVYSLIVLIWHANRIKKKGYITAYSIMSVTSIYYKFTLNTLGPKYLKLIYMLNYTGLVIMVSAISYYSYHSLIYNYLYVFAFALLACYNGATFYIRVVGKKYYEREDKQKKQ